MPAAGVREERLNPEQAPPREAGGPCRPAVVFLTSAFPVRADGGADAVLARRARALAELTEVAVVVPTPWAPQWLGRLALRWRTYAETPRRLTVMGVETFYPRYVQIPTRWFVPLAPLAMAAGSLPRLRNLRRAGRLDVLYAQAVLPDGLAGALLGKVLGVPSVCLARGTDVNVMGRRTRVGRWLTRLTVRWSAGVAAVGYDLRDTLVSLAPDYREPEVLYDGIDLDAFRPADRRIARARLGLREDGPLILYVGRLVVGKGVDTLVDAFAEVLAAEPNAGLAIVGDGDLHMAIRRQVDRRGLTPAVIFPGERPYEEIPYWMQAANVVTLPSESEGFPNVVREALACGRPVVATPVGELRRIVSPPVGRLVPVGDRVALAAALVEVLHTEFRPQEIRTAVQDATWSLNAAVTLAFLGTALNRGRRFGDR